MSNNRITRRDLLLAATASVITAATTRRSIAQTNQTPAGSKSQFRYCFNTSTIRGQNLSLDKEIEIAAAAGYDSLEPWVNKIHDYAKASGSLTDLRKRIEDSHLTVESAISFFQWVIDDDAERAKGLEQAKRDMDVLAQIGGKRIAAPPAGATQKPGLDLTKAAERYRVLLELGDKIGVVPQLEIWGPSANLHRLGQAMFVVVEAGHPNACLLPDVYHTYKGGSDFNGLKAISANAIRVFHINDYPADPPRQTISDRDRIYPGDGIAPLTQIIGDLNANNPRCILSLELFNPNYWKLDPLEVAKIGLAKMKSAINTALGAA